MKKRFFKRKSSTIKRSTSKRKTITLAKKRRFSRRSVSRRTSSAIRTIGSARGKFGGFLKKGLVGDTTSALGAGVLVGAAADKVVPQYSPFIQLGAEYAAGGVGGMVLAEGLKAMIGAPSVLNGLLGNFGIGGGGMMTAPQGL